MSTKPTNWIMLIIAAMVIATTTARDAAGSLIVPGYTDSVSATRSGAAGKSNNSSPPKKERPDRNPEDFRTPIDASGFTSTDRVERPFSSIALYALYSDFAVFDLLCTKLVEWPKERLPEPEPFRLLRPPDLSVVI